MNQHIQELLKQATDNILGVPVVDQKKFAELIVRECACIADDMKSLDVAEEIKQHFGVEE